MYISLFFIIVGAFHSVASDVPDGFGGGVLEKVLSGEVVVENAVQEEFESRYYIRAYFNDVSKEEYASLATDHSHYPELFPEVKFAQTTKTNPEKTEFDYKMRLIIETKLGGIPLFPKLHQTVTPSPETDGEDQLQNELLNYKDHLDFATQKTRLIPYSKGLLIEDDIHFLTKKDVTKELSTKLLEFFKRYVLTFKAALGGLQSLLDFLNKLDLNEK